MKKTMVVMVDDIDGSTADHSVTFMFNGVSWEIDLSDEHYREMEEDFAKWETYARRSGGRARTRRTTSGGSSAESAKIREWARSQGIEVSDRGRIPAAVRKQYEAAN